MDNGSLAEKGTGMLITGGDVTDQVKGGDKSVPVQILTEKSLVDSADSETSI